MVLSYEPLSTPRQSPPSASSSPVGSPSEPDKVRDRPLRPVSPFSGSAGNTAHQVRRGLLVDAHAFGGEKQDVARRSRSRVEPFVRRRSPRTSRPRARTRRTHAAMESGIPCPRGITRCCQRGPRGVIPHRRHPLVRTPNARHSNRRDVPAQHPYPRPGGHSTSLPEAHSRHSSQFRGPGETHEPCVENVEGVQSVNGETGLEGRSQAWSERQRGRCSDTMSAACRGRQCRRCRAILGEESLLVVDSPYWPFNHLSNRS